MKNTLFQSLDNDRVMTEDAKRISSTLDMLTSAIVGRLISERVIDYAGQPGQTIEYVSCAIADTLVEVLPTVDTVELLRFIEGDSSDEK